MTEEEKNKEVDNYLKNTFKFTEQNQLVIMIGSKCFTDGLEKGLGENKKEIVILKAQIEKMKCCGNCKNYTYIDEVSACCLKDHNYAMREFNICEDWK